uniref:Uncharacterized protein n=2 Tax=Meloidogyne TaxID=189290 RepID=A0A6V7VA76_MELEN|nr:unnamed protein product [Meloidogyne enterolobii]
MTLTKKQQNNKQIPTELIFEIIKSIEGYPNLIINEEINGPLKHQKYSVWKIKCSENVLISSKIFCYLCGEALRITLVNKVIMDNADKNKKEDEDSYEKKKQALVQEKEERLAKIVEDNKQGKVRLAEDKEKKFAQIEEENAMLSSKWDEFDEKKKLDVMKEFKEKDEKLDAEFGKLKRARSPSGAGSSTDPIVFEAEGPTEVPENEGGEEVQEDEGGPPKEKKGKFESA